MSKEDFNKAKRELEGFNSIVTSDYTDLELLLCRKFYKAGIDLDKIHTEEKINVAVKALEKIEERARNEKNETCSRCHVFPAFVTIEERSIEAIKSLTGKPSA